MAADVPGTMIKTAMMIAAASVFPLLLPYIPWQEPGIRADISVILAILQAHGRLSDISLTADQPYPSGCSHGLEGTY